MPPPKKKSSTCEPRQNLALLSMESWLVNEDLYVMVYEIAGYDFIPYTTNQPCLFSLLVLNGVITPINEVITLLLTGFWDPPCKIRSTRSTVFEQKISPRRPRKPSKSLHSLLPADSPATTHPNFDVPGRKLGSMVRINGLFHLLINGVYWGYIIRLLTF